MTVAFDLSIVVPVFNEEDNILPLAKELARAVGQESGSYEIVFVDDGSVDHTWSRIREARRLNPCVRGLRHLRNLGQSAALWTGLSATNSPIVATLDGDLQNDPADIPKLLLELRDCDFVCGVRTQRQDSELRCLSSRVARVARRLVLGVDFIDVGCALRVFRRTVLTGVFPFNGMHRFLPILVHGSGFRTREVPVLHRPRVAGISKYGIRNRLFRGVLDLMAMAWYQRRRIGRAEIEEMNDEDVSRE